MSSMSVLKRRRDDEDPSPSTFITVPIQKKPRADSSEPTSSSSSSSAITTDLALLHALDFSTLDTNATIAERFDLIGHALLHDFALVVRSEDVETQFEILELEFYLRKDGCHEDPFAHASEEQKTSGRWYFHRAPRRSADSHRSATSLTGYRGGSRKGLDLTLGGPAPAPAPPTITSPYFSQPTNRTPTNASSKSESESESDRAAIAAIRGGALLRSLRRVSDSKVISGPSRLVDEILRLSKATSISELVELKWSNNTSAFASPRPTSTSVFLRPKATLLTSGATKMKKPTPAVYRSPRIGLDLSHPGTSASASHPRVVFLPRRYRYFTHPRLLTFNGRTQTFLGVLRACLCLDDAACAGQDLDLGDGRLLKALIRITGLSEAVVTRYLTHFRGGVESGQLTDFVGVQGKEASSSPATYLRMMGTLERYRVSHNESSEA